MSYRRGLSIILAVLMAAALFVPWASAAELLLTIGSSGQPVKELQQALRARGFDPGPLDGIFGPRTLAAVKAFQKSAGLAVDGIVGPETRAALRGPVISARSVTARSNRTDLALAGRRIVIDPGHGGANPGALGVDGSREADNVLAIGLKLRQKLIDAGAEVIMTRSTNVQPRSPFDPDAHQLKARTDIANSSGAELFVSIHNNSYPQNPSVSGIMTFSRRNDAVSKKISTIINQELCRATGWPNKGIEEASFYVLRNTKMPAVLVEIGFMTNASDVALLKTDAMREKAAQGIYQGILLSLGKR